MKPMPTFTLTLTLPPAPKDTADAVQVADAYHTLQHGLELLAEQVRFLHDAHVQLVFMGESGQTSTAHSDSSGCEETAVLPQAATLPNELPAVLKAIGDRITQLEAELPAEHVQAFLDDDTLRDSTAIVQSMVRLRQTIGTLKQAWDPLADHNPGLVVAQLPTGKKD
jgi:hypothetical protein